MKKIIEKLYLASIVDESISQMKQDKQLEIQNSCVFFQEGNPVYSSVLQGFVNGQFELLNQAKLMLDYVDSESLPEDEKRLYLLVYSAVFTPDGDSELNQRIKNIGYKLHVGE